LTFDLPAWKLPSERAGSEARDTAGRTMRNLVIILGDQLDAGSAAFDGFDPGADAVWMAEVAAEADYVWSTKTRLVMFLSAMRHFREDQRANGRTVLYRELDDPANRGSFAAELAAAVAEHKPERLVMVQPGTHRVREEIAEATREAGAELEVRPDRHFLCTTGRFAEYAADRKQLRMEHFYRGMRREHDVLMDDGDPAGGQWNFDADNRGRFGRDGPGDLPPTPSFPPDETTREVIRLIDDRFGDRPGRLSEFNWPVTPEQARASLDYFIEHRLAAFGPYQDAMWTGRPLLHHSRLSAAMNLKLLDPREAIASAEQAWRAGHAPIASAEGFIRQVLGWREYVRGVYWRLMPGYLGRNTLAADAPLPGFYWTGRTDAACLAEVIGQTLDLGYAHHIQRLMVTGLFALLLGVDPVEVHRWYLAVYADAVEWVELPNTLGMSQFADDGVMASKPYCASGKYIHRMSNYCRDCRYRPGDAAGERACPFTALYWDFLRRHRRLLGRNPRAALQVRNLERKTDREVRAIARRGERLREEMLSGE
jgi:deoxyribodipyrimidine photolyase-related protein